MKVNQFYIREDVVIDLSRVMNASALIAGRTRSGKTTGILSVFILPALMQGRDEFGSEIVIVDPKSAELSMCPHVLAPKLDGDVEHIYEAVCNFNRARVVRQRIINEAGLAEGKAVKWWDLGMHASILFLDEYVSLQGMLPKKASKEKPNYSLEEFKNQIRQIATQGASAGCFLILSTAEASVGTGGLEAAVNKACGIRVLFKPSKAEASYLWSSEQLEVLRERRFGAGDAWFSADDGLHDRPRFVKFPFLEFGEYEALSVLLTQYYEEKEHRAEGGDATHCASVKTS